MKKGKPAFSSPSITMKKGRVSKPAISSSSTDASDSEKEDSPSPPTAALNSVAADSASDSGESDHDVPLQKVASKSTDDGSRVRKPVSKPNSKAPAKTPKKRPGAAAAEKSPKKLKAAEKGGSVEEQVKKSVLIQRLWTDEDEIAILKGVIEYREKKGADPLANAVDFYDFVKKSLQIDVDRTQILRKLRRLKERYGNTLSKRKYLNPHDKLVAEFGAKIWGNSAEIGQQNKSNSKAKTAGNEAGEYIREGSKTAGNEAGPTQEGKKGGSFLELVFSSMGLMNENLAKAGLELCTEDEKAELEEKWRKVRMEEGEIAVKKVALAHESVETIMAALRRSG